jgi:hypothetical protein
MITNTIKLNFGLSPGDQIPYDVIDEYNAGNSGAIGNWIHDQYAGYLNYQAGEGADMIIGNLPLELKSKQVSSKNTSWTIGTASTKQIVTCAYENTALANKSKFLILIGYDIKRFGVVTSVDTVDISNSDVQQQLKQYYEVAQQDILRNFSKKAKSHEKMGDSRGVYFERNGCSESWAWRVTPRVMKKFISDSNFYSNSLFDY